MTQPQRSWWVRPGARMLEQAVAQLDRVTAQRRQDASIQGVVKCCYLALDPDPGCYSWCINHGGGYWIQYWWCCHAGYRYQCQECTNGSNCYGGDILCSNIAGQWLC